MKYFVFSDIHGCVKLLKKELNQASYDENNPNHMLLFLGDAFDKGKDDYAMYLFLKEQIEKKKIIWTMGNHEVYLIKVLRNKKMNSFCKETIEHIGRGIANDSENTLSIDECFKIVLENNLLSFIENNTVHYFETANYFFTHGFVPCDKKNNKIFDDFRNAPDTKWNLCHQMNGIDLTLKGMIIPNKKLVCGHVGSFHGNVLLKHPELINNPTELKRIKKKISTNPKNYIDYLKIYNSENVIGIDGRCYETEKVNLLIINE